MTVVLFIALVGVIAGHFLFSYAQWFRWQDVCERLTDLGSAEVEKTRFLGRSFASYNASIGVGVCLSFLLPGSYQTWTQAVVLILIVLTAIVGASGTRGNFILYMRLSPAAIALIALVAREWL